MERESYGIERWGEGYFTIQDGHVFVHPARSEGGDLVQLVQTLVAQGIDPPILIRFNGILRDRLRQISNAFKEAIAELSYRNHHQMVFPLKVNPQRHVIDSVLHAGEELNIGLEVGSKPELIAILATDRPPDRLLLCNGYKDAEYIELALMAKKLGQRTLIIIEQSYELQLVLNKAEELGVQAEIGFRMKLGSRGSGRWEASAGEHSKFGLFTDELLVAIELLTTQGKRDWAKLLHFHMGSQITSIDAIKKALKEATRMYTEVQRLLPSLSFFDVGGGLAVDYDGTKSASDSSMNYSLEEYARDIVAAIGEACLAANIEDPVIITESGRAVVSHHALLITEVIDVAPSKDGGSISFSSEAPELLKTLQELEEQLTLKNCRETFHDVLEIKERMLEEFIYGKVTVQTRGLAEKKTRQLLYKIHAFHKLLSAEERDLLDKLLQETYFCNFSLFQSLPDSWAIAQLFPIMPIQRLGEPAHHLAVLADLTCDSDGKIDHFIGSQRFMLHEYKNEPYFVGIFLVGAYQEILGGLHNLFGDTNVVHAELNAEGKWELSRLVEGDTVQEVLHYVQFNTEGLMTQLHEAVERSLKANRITLQESAAIKKRFKQALESYTYLVV